MFRYAIAALLTTNLLLGGGDTFAQESSKSTLDLVKERGTLLAGVRNDFPPYGYINKDGNWTGFEIEFVDMIAKQLGVKVQYVQVTSNTRIPLLINGNIDLVVAQMNPTAERAKTIDFTQPYTIGLTRVMTLKGSGVNTVLDLAPPRKIGAVQGAVNDLKIVQKFVPNVQFKIFQEWTLAAVALSGGQVDGIVTTETTLRALQKNDPRFIIVGDALQFDPAVIGVRQNDSRWRLFLEEFIMRGWSDGTLKVLYKKYTGAEPSYFLHVWPDIAR